MNYTNIKVTSVNLDGILTTDMSHELVVEQAISYAFEKGLNVNLSMEDKTYNITPSMFVELILSQHPVPSITEPSVANPVAL